MKSEQNLVHIQPGCKDHKNCPFFVRDGTFQRARYSAPIITMCTACSGIVGEIKNTKPEQNRSASDNHKQFHVSNRQTYASNMAKLVKRRFRGSEDVGFTHSTKTQPKPLKLLFTSDSSLSQCSESLLLGIKLFIAKIEYKQVFFPSLPFCMLSIRMLSVLSIPLNKEIRITFRDQPEELCSYTPKEWFVTILWEKAVWWNFIYKYLFREFCLKIQFKSKWTMLFHFTWHSLTHSVIPFPLSSHQFHSSVHQPLYFSDAHSHPSLLFFFTF